MIYFTRWVLRKISLCFISGKTHSGSHSRLKYLSFTWKCLVWTTVKVAITRVNTNKSNLLSPTQLSNFQKMPLTRDIILMESSSFSLKITISISYIYFRLIFVFDNESEDVHNIDKKHEFKVIIDRNILKFMTWIQTMLMGSIGIIILRIIVIAVAHTLRMYFRKRT